MGERSARICPVAKGRRSGRVGPSWMAVLVVGSIAAGCGGSAASDDGAAGSAVASTISIGSLPPGSTPTTVNTSTVTTATTPTTPEPTEAPATDAPVTATHAPTTTTAPPSTAAPTVPEPVARSFVVMATGDILTEQLVLDSAAAAAGPGVRYDFAPLFAPIATGIASADLAICHMELPIGVPGARPGVYGRSPDAGNLLLAPNEIARGIADVGFDRCSTASNHALDLGFEGITSTLDALDAVGLGHAGTARSEEESANGMAEVLDVAGVRVSHLSYTRFSNMPRSGERWWMNFAGDVEQVAADILRARAAGAEVVIVSLHIAKEMLTGPTGYDRDFITELTATVPIDLIVEHGPHVIQPVEVVNGTVVYWSVGNLLSGMGVPGTGKYEDQRTLDGLIAGVRFTESEPGEFEPEDPRIDGNQPLSVLNQSKPPRRASLQ